MNTARNIKSFILGKLIVTRTINDDIANNEVFAYEVMKALSRYQVCDWGDTCKEDSILNNKAIIEDNRVLASYNTSLGKIWIITEWDRSYTTILYPSEY